MKTSLAIVLAVAALAVGTATLAISNPAFAGGDGPRFKGWCGAATCAHGISNSQERIVGGKPQ